MSNSFKDESALRDITLRASSSQWKSRSVFGVTLITSFIIIGSSRLEGLFPSSGQGSLIFGLVAAVIIITGWQTPRHLFHSLIFSCVAFPHWLESISLSLGMMKLYFHDIVFLVLYCSIGAQLLKANVRIPKIQYLNTVSAYVMIGLIAAGIGLLNGNPYANVFGDFRRTFFYFTAIFFPFFLIRNQTETENLVGVIVVGSLTLILKGIVQAGTGAFDVRRVGDVAHVLSHFEGVFITFAIYWAILNLVSSASSKLFWMIIAIVGTVVVGLTNFRSCWIALAAGTSTVCIFTPRAKIVKLWVTITVIVIASATMIFAIWKIPVHETKSTVGDNLVAKASFARSLTDQNIQWRIDSYKNALSLWSSQPVLGTGLGEILQFHTRTSTGEVMIVSGHRVHNSYLWLLMSLGVFGFLLFAYLHVVYIITVIKSVQSSDRTMRRILIAIVAFYFSIMTLACFDVCLESSPPVILLGTIMGLSVLLSKDLVTFPRTRHCAIPASPQ